MGRFSEVPALAAEAPNSRDGNSGDDTGLLRWKKRDISGPMSGHGHHAADAALDTGHEEETSSDDFPADEPRSPGWLPLLGGALFLACIFAFVAMASDGKTTEELAKDAAAANPSAAASGAADPARRPAPAIPVGAVLPANHPQLPPAPGN
ncbi:MAG TPA: hypothetical protein VNW92_28550 [Polyangiaceae bacterium]|nr:hypothetical protein [Polyangiaceae bacterium]